MAKKMPNVRKVPKTAENCRTGALGGENNGSTLYDVCQRL